MVTGLLTPDAWRDEGNPVDLLPAPHRAVSSLAGDMPSGTLGERFRDGEETALHEIYRLYAGLMFGAALGILNDRELAADAVQQAFVQAWRSASTFDPRRDLRPWLYVIVRRTAIDVYRREHHSSRHISLDDIEQEIPVVGPSLEDTWQIWQVREALGQLCTEERQVIQLTYYGGYTQREIGHFLGISVGTVNGRISRARQRLSQLLAHIS